MIFYVESKYIQIVAGPRERRGERNTIRQCWFNTNKQHSVCKILLFFSLSSFALILLSGVMLFIVEYILHFIVERVQCYSVCLYYIFVWVSHLCPFLASVKKRVERRVCYLSACYITLQCISITFHLEYVIDNGSVWMVISIETDLTPTWDIVKFSTGPIWKAPFVVVLLFFSALCHTDSISKLVCIS